MTELQQKTTQNYPPLPDNSELIQLIKETYTTAYNLLSTPKSTEELPTQSPLLSPFKNITDAYLSLADTHTMQELEQLPQKIKDLTTKLGIQAVVWNHWTQDIKINQLINDKRAQLKPAEPLDVQQLIHLATTLRVLNATLGSRP